MSDHQDKKGNTPLHVALRYNECFDKEVVRILLNAGANLHLQDRQGKTPIAPAKSTGRNPRVEFIEMLQMLALLGSSTPKTWCKFYNTIPY